MAKDRKVFPRPNLVILMQDGAPAHTAKATMERIREQFPSVWRDWPGNSPDLNPIEHLWARVQDSVLRQPRPRNREELIKRVRQEWNSITQNDIYKLIESFSRRIVACLQQDGHCTKY